MSYNQVGPQYTPQPPRKSHRIRNAFILIVLFPAGVVIAAVIVAYALSPADNALEYSKPSPTITSSADQTITPAPATKSKATPPVPKKAAIPDDGVWMVPSEVKPGTYRSTANADCYWARLSDLGDSLNGIIANGFGKNQTVTIKATDEAFETRSCGGWVKIK